MEKSIFQKKEFEMDRSEKGKMVSFVKTIVIILNERFFPTNILKKRKYFPVPPCTPLYDPVVPVTNSSPKHPFWYHTVTPAPLLLHGIYISLIVVSWYL